MTEIKVRLGLQQRILPSYRVQFFETLASACAEGMSVFAGSPHSSEAVGEGASLSKAKLARARNFHLLGGSLYLCWQAGLIRWLEDWQPEALIVEANPRNLRTTAAVRWMHTRGRPVIGWGLGASTHKGILGWVRSGWHRRFFRQFDAMISYSKHGAETYHSTGIHPDSIFVAVNAVVPRPAHPIPERSGVFEGDKPVVLYVGRLQARKRVDLLLRACAALPEGKQPYLWLVGEGPERGKLEDLAESIYPSAQFYGACFNGELEPLFREADLFVLPGTGGLAVQHAMSYGLPVVVAEADGTQVDLVRSQNGWIVPPGDLDDLREVLSQALSDCSRLRQMGQASFDIVCEMVNLGNMVKVFGQALDTVMEL